MRDKSRKGLWLGNRDPFEMTDSLGQYESGCGFQNHGEDSYDRIDGETVSPLRKNLALVRANGGDYGEECTEGNDAAHHFPPPGTEISMTVPSGIVTVASLVG